MRTVSVVGRFSPNHGYRVRIGRELDLTRVVILPRKYNDVRKKGGSQGYKQGDDYVKPWNLS